MADPDLGLGTTREFIGRTTSLEGVIATLVEHGCPDLTLSVDFAACTELPLAGGGFCDVYQGSLINETRVALKTSRVFYRPGKDNGDEKIIKRAARELYNWSRLKHPNVLPLMGLALFRGHLSMISKWMENGNLMSYVRLNPSTDRVKLVHGDLKSANVMISPNGEAMIADFGNSRLRDLTLKFTDTTSSSFSFRWAAPEVLLQDSGPLASKEADVYAYGMTALEALTGKVPYEGVGEQRVFGLVAYEHKPPLRSATGIDDEIWDILLFCWTWEVSKRPTIASIERRLQALTVYSSLSLETMAHTSSSSILNPKLVETPLEAQDNPSQDVGSHSPPIGIVRLWIKRAKHVKNVETILSGKSDPYVRVLLNSVVVARTEVKPNGLDPEWDEIVYVPVHGLHETLYLECVDYKQLVKHRSLGFVKLPIADLAKATDDRRVPYSGTGRRDIVDAIRMDKGELHYAAEFFPAVGIQSTGFTRNDNARRGTFYGGSLERNNEEFEFGPDQEAALVTRGASSPIISKDELLAQQSGIIVFNVIDGEVAKKARLEILLDGGRWPVLATERAHSTRARWNQVGEGFVKELDFGRVWLRLNKDGGDDKDDIIANYKLDTRDFLEKTLDTTYSFVLTNDDGKNQNPVRIHARYIPVEIELEPRESINDMGILRVELIDGKELRGADRRGKSDPSVIFILNQSRVFKSSVKKKTLAPEWFEEFEVSVPSRVGANFSLEVFHWNQVGIATSLGSSQIELAGLEPFTRTICHLQLTSPEHGTKGTIQIRLLFRPEIVAKAHTKTLSLTAGRARTQVGGAALGVGRAIGRELGIFRRSNSDNISRDLPPVPVGRPIDDNGQTSSDDDRAPTAVVGVPPLSTIGPGTLKVTLHRAWGLSCIEEGTTAKPFVILKIGDKDVRSQHVRSNMPEWNEIFTFLNITAEIRTVHILVLDKKTLGRDPILAEGSIGVWSYIQPLPTPPILRANIAVPLDDHCGTLQLRLEFEHPTFMKRE